MRELLVALLLSLFLLSSSGSQLEKDLIVLTDDTFEEELDRYDMLLVLFYVPWW